MFEIELFICIKMDSVLNKLQWLIYHESKLNQKKENLPKSETTEKNKESEKRNKSLDLARELKKIPKNYGT